MPVIAVAFCPHPPLLVSPVGIGENAELHRLRAACASAVAWLLEFGPDRVLLAGSEPGPDVTSGTGSFAPWGVRMEVPLGGGGEPSLPLSLSVGAWLLDQAGWAGPVRTALADVPERAVALVLGDGTACRGTGAPGYLDVRAEPFDDAVVTALAAADQAALAALDPPAELLVSGISAWRAAAALPGPWQGTVDYAAAPYGVAYTVARWTRA